MTCKNLRLGISSARHCDLCDQLLSMTLIYALGIAVAICSVSATWTICRADVIKPLPTAPRCYRGPSHQSLRSPPVSAGFPYLVQSNIIDDSYALLRGLIEMLPWLEGRKVTENVNQQSPVEEFVSHHSAALTELVIERPSRPTPRIWMSLRHIEIL